MVRPSALPRRQRVGDLWPICLVPRTRAEPSFPRMERAQALQGSPARPGTRECWFSWPRDEWRGQPSQHPQLQVASPLLLPPLPRAETYKSESLIALQREPVYQVAGFVGTVRQDVGLAEEGLSTCPGLYLEMQEQGLASGLGFSRSHSCPLFLPPEPR